MNKPQERKQYKPQQSNNKLCTAIVEGRACQYGDSCKFSHDLEVFMRERPADLGEVCPIYTLKGMCKFGANCRFGACHIDPHSGVNVQPQDAAANLAGAPPEEKNIVGWELTQQLRKNKFDFSRADALATRFNALVQGQHNVHQSGPADGAAAAADGPTAAAEGGVATVVDGAAAATDGNSAAVDGTAAAAGGAADGTPAADGTAATAAADGAAAGEPPPTSAYHARAAEDCSVPLHERKLVDFRGKLYLAPLTTVGNMPFRRVCKAFGADITCGEMALATSLLQGSHSEWALLKRHASEDLFGVQLAGNQAQPMGRVAQLIDERVDVDFVDINMGCPIDSVCNRGMGASFALRPGRVQAVVRTMSSVLSCPLTVKMRVGYENDNPTAHKLIPRIVSWGATAVTLHGRTRQQRYTKTADWDYIRACGALTRKLTPAGVPLIGNGDVFSYDDACAGMGLGMGLPQAENGGGGGGGGSELSAVSGAIEASSTGVSTVMLARGALVKPWVFTEIKERRHWDISASERLDILRQFTRYGLEHWGTDDIGVSRVRKFLLEWLSFLCRYVPVGVLERLPARLNDRPPAFVGRNDLETLFASTNAADWVKITEMLLGPVPSGFTFTPKHKANAYDSEASMAAIETEG